MNSHEFAAKVAEDKAASFTLQRMIATAAERDVLDALIDAEALAAFCRLRAQEAGVIIPMQGVDAQAHAMLALSPADR